MEHCYYKDTNGIARQIMDEFETQDIAQYVEIGIQYDRIHNSIVLQSLKATPKFKGFGTIGMINLCQIVDKFKLRIGVKPDNSVKYLERFYSKFGFKYKDENYREMFRDCKNL